MVVLRCVFVFFLCVGDVKNTEVVFFFKDAQLTRILQILHGIFVDEHIPRGLQGMDT